MLFQRAKLPFYVFFLALGLVSSLLQMVFLREILTSFRGNELFLNYFLICWLVIVGLGSLISSRRLKNEVLAKFVSLYYLILGFFCLAFFIIIRLLPQILNFTAETPDLALSLILLPLGLLTTCFLLGMGFSWASKHFDAFIPGSTGFNVNGAYLLEIFGFFLGSLIFNFWLVKIPAFKIILLAIVAGLAIGLFVSFREKRKAAIFIFINLSAIIVAGYVLAGKTGYLERETSAWRFPNEKLIKTFNSSFGNIAVTEKEKQYNFYEQGNITVPENFSTSEELIHLPLLFAPADKISQNVFLAGNAWSGLLKEALKYPDSKISYAEMDPEFIPAVYEFLPPESRQNLKNPAVKIINRDAFSFLKSDFDSRSPTSGISKFDFILLNLPPPSTYQTNRYYTREFFEIAKKNLNPDGIFAVSFPYYAENPRNSNLNRFFNSIFGVFSRVFPNNVLIPGQKLILIGFENANMEWEIGKLTEKFKKQSLETHFLSTDYIEYLLTNKRREQISEEIALAPGLSNTNWTPSGVIYRFIGQIELSQPKMAHFLNWLFSCRWFIFGFIVLAPICLVLLLKKRLPETKIKFIAYFASSLTLILEIILIFAWQINIGYIFRQISLIIGLVMLGIFLANLHLYLKPPENKEKAIKVFLLSLITLTAVLPLFLISFKYQPLFFIKFAILAFSLISGYLAGAIYPLANYLYLEKNPAPREETGKIYALELLGGGLLLVIFALFILPFFGLLASACFLIYWVLVSFLLVISPRKFGR